MVSSPGQLLDGAQDPGSGEDFLSPNFSALAFDQNL
jgi:hypothetical protein